MKFGIVYISTNKLNNKSYIGKTFQTLNQRKIGHEKLSLRMREGKFISTTYFSNAIRKYGKENFEWEILYTDVPSELLSYMEQIAICWHKTSFIGYNSTDGGDGGLKTEATKIKLRENAHTYKDLNEEQKRKHFESMKNISLYLSEKSKELWLDEKYRDKTLKALRKKTSSEEFKHNVSISQKKRFENSEERKKNSRIKNNEEKLKISNSLKENQNALGHKKSEETKKLISEKLKGNKNRRKK